MTRKPFPLQLLAAAVLALAATAPAQAGEALDIEMPSMRTPIENSVPLLSPRYTLVVTPASGAMTREQVREELRQARANGTMSTFGEAGDTGTVLAAREQFNLAQAAEIRAAYAAEAERQQLLAQAETQAQLMAAATVGDSMGEPLPAATDAMAVQQGTATSAIELDPGTNPDMDPEVDPAGMALDMRPETEAELDAELAVDPALAASSDIDRAAETDVRIEFIDMTQP